MKFDIKAHLQDHAYYFKQYHKEINNDDLHFNFSYLDIQFFDREQKPEEILKTLLEELKQPAEYKVSNGWRTLKNGTKKQKYTTRKINLAKDIKIEAIHTIGANGEYTMPHIHLILNPKGRYGKNYSLLKQHIETISQKFGLKPNFAEAPINNPNSYRNLGKAVRNFSWIIRKMPNNEFKKYIEKENFINKLQNLYEYTLLSGNLQYYIKTMNYIRKRLQNLKMDKKVILRGKEFNLREFYPLPLTEQDKKVIDLINEKKFSQKDILPHLKNPIMRDFVRYSYFKDKKKALIIKELTEQTTLFKHIKPNSKVVNNFVKLYTKHELPLTREKAIKKNIQQKQQESIKEILKNDLLQVAKQCKNEKELRQKMQELGYKEFGFKKKSGKVFGYQFIPKNIPKNESKKIVVKCADTIPISEIRAILKENYLKYKATLQEPKKQQITSKIGVYTLPREIKPQQKLLPVLYKQDFKIIKEETKKLKELSEQKLLPKPQSTQQIRIELPRLKLTLTIPQKLLQRRAYGKTIAKYLTTIERNTRELKELSKRKFTIKRESPRVRSETKLFRERITTSITNTFKEFGNTITSKFGETIGRLGKRLKKYLKAKNEKELEEFSKRAGNTITRANIAKYTIKPTITRTEQLDREIKEQTKRSERIKSEANREIERSERIKRKLNEAIGRIGTRFTEKITRIKGRLGNKFKRIKQKLKGIFANRIEKAIEKFTEANRDKLERLKEEMEIEKQVRELQEKLKKEQQTQEQTNQTNTWRIKF